MLDKTKKTRSEIVEWNRIAHKKVHPQLTQKDVYENYIKENPKEEITYEEYKKVITQFNWYFMNYVIYTGFTILLPFFLGTFSVIRKASRGYKIDFHHFKTTGERKKHYNKHSERYYARFYWNKSSKRYHNRWFKHLFLFKSNRLIRADLAKAIKNHNTIYKYQYYET